jgi:DNA ligase (NAD+)
MDGLTCSLKYLDGKLVAAETRGDGFVGEDILHNALVIPSIPKRIPYYDELVVDGEIICSVADFAEFSDEYKNPRNFAAGSIRLLDANECATRKLQFIAWDVIKGLDFVPNLTTKLSILQSEYYFTCVPFAIGHVAECIDKIQHAAVEFGYPIDGVVFKFNNVEYGRTLGETTHHFKNAIAYKFYDESFPTQLRAIDWTMGRIGVLTPVAIFESIDMDGSEVSRASLHNINIMQETLGTPWVGQPLKVFQANMIMPQIAEADKNTLVTSEKSIDIPK